MTTRIAVYAGTFDPITNGHVEMVRRGLSLFDKVVVLVAKNPRKQTMFMEDQRTRLVRKVFKEEPRVEVDSFDGLLVTYMERNDYRFLLRGLRAVSDFDGEFAMALTNRHLTSPDFNVESVFLMASEEYRVSIPCL